jgi:hypothetical protein
MKKIFPLALILGIIILSFTNCKKIRGDLILGEWEIIPVAGSDTMKGPPTWTFHEGNEVTRKWRDWNFNANPPTYEWIYDTAFYYIEEEVDKLFITVHGFDENTDGNYNVEQLSQRTMIIEQVRPYMHKEFVRVTDN